MQRIMNIKTHSGVSAAKKAMWHTSSGTVNSPSSTLRISITSGLISIKLTNVMPSIYATWHTKLERNWPNNSWDMCSWKLSHFFTFSFFFFFTPFYKSNFEPTKDTLLWMDFFQIGTLIKHLVSYFGLKFGDVSAECKGVMDDNIVKTYSKSLVLPTG